MFWTYHTIEGRGNTVRLTAALYATTRLNKNGPKGMGMKGHPRDLSKSLWERLVTWAYGWFVSVSELFFVVWGVQYGRMHS